jgi:hypothetical protein
MYAREGNQDPSVETKSVKTSYWFVEDKMFISAIFPP